MPLGEVVEVGVSRTYDLRSRVLRDGRGGGFVQFPEDEDPATFHLAVVDDAGDTLGVATFSPRPTVARPEAAAPVQLRGMAVEPSRQGLGVGTRLMLAALDRLRQTGADVLWANARDPALGFYRGFGMEVVGEGFTSVFGGGHHLVVVDLAR